MITASARNNAEWCDTMCRAHGSPGIFGERAWTSERRTPPLYPDAVTLSPLATAREVLDGIDRETPGCSVKDSFGHLDLSAEGFDVLFEARWIHRPAALAAPVAPDGVTWRPVRTVRDLTAWETAWAGGDGSLTGLFRPELLADRATTVLAATTDRGRRMVAGAVVSRSGSVIGISNLFATDADSGPDSGPDAGAGAGADADAGSGSGSGSGSGPESGADSSTGPGSGSGSSRSASGLDRAWAGCLATVARVWPGIPVVGYESGDSLDAAADQGCVPGGTLRVWLADGLG
ncbi:hypothetical protein [Streptomyces sp. FIT100]|uniref:hypothetical protein n=1 Tax=Streptomyces sp. FIT100 TaxID=2837956 RepID=UPI0021C8F6EF|nr:hypothetical protein [Streptomyces sp. FIT100]